MEVAQRYHTQLGKMGICAAKVSDYSVRYGREKANNHKRSNQKEAEKEVAQRFLELMNSANGESRDKKPKLAAEIVQGEP